MITNKGKSVISKYLVGQTGSYASYLAIGCGETPQVAGHQFTTEEKDSMRTKECLDFEMLRVPITSRGYVTEVVDGITTSKLVLTAQIPSEERFGITEIGIFPSETNPVAQNNDSRTFFSFSESESWVYKNYETSTHVDYLIPNIVKKLTSGGTSDSIVINTGPDGNAEGFSSDHILDGSAFSVASSNVSFSNEKRIITQEVPRYLNSSVFVTGGMSDIAFSGPTTTVSTSSDYLILPSSGIDLSNNSSLDKLKLAFSVVGKDATELAVPDTVTVVVEFGSDNAIGSGAYARAIFTASADELEASRYVVSDVLIKDIVTSGSFSWSSVNYVKVFVDTTVPSGSVSSDFYIALDGLRLENVYSVSPVYGLVGYTVIKNSINASTGPEAAPVIKGNDQTQFVEFRFVADVV